MSERNITQKNCLKNINVVFWLLHSSIRNIDLKIYRKFKTCFPTNRTGHSMLSPFSCIIKLLFSHEKTRNWLLEMSCMPFVLVCHLWPLIWWSCMSTHSIFRKIMSNFYNGFISVFMSHNTEHNIVRGYNLVFILLQTTENPHKMLSQDYSNFKFIFFSLFKNAYIIISSRTYFVSHLILLFL